MSYISHLQLRYRIAERGEIPDGRTVDIKDRPGGQAEILLDADHSGPQLPLEITQLCSHSVVHGLWRQRWTHDGRMSLPAQGLRLAVSRWERVPQRRLPSGLVVFGVEEDGSAIWLIDEDACSMQLQNDMNDMLLRLAGDGLWIQAWFRHQPAPITSEHTPLTPSTTPPALV